VKFKPDIVFVFKGSYVSSFLLRRITALKIHYHPDDSSNIVNRTRTFSKAEVNYDIHFTSKKHNISEIAERTKKAVHFIYYAYDRNWHYNLARNDFYGDWNKIGFIGHYRPDRHELIEKIARSYGKSFYLYGNDWYKISGLKYLSNVHKPVYGKLFSKVVNEIPLQLGLLNSDNRDQHTARSFEVPASGGLLLAQDTAEHREIFGINGGVLYFSNLENLLQQVEWVRNHSKEANMLAMRGYNNIVNGMNDWHQRAIEVMTIINKF
jgi:spore maturation protein CgeB